MIKKGKMMHCTSADTIRELVEYANEIGIQREDIVALLEKGNKNYLVYYYGGVDENGNSKA